jgi:hypothetical protein
VIKKFFRDINIQAAIVGAVIGGFFGIFSAIISTSLTADENISSFESLLDKYTKYIENSKKLELELSTAKADAFEKSRDASLAKSERDKYKKLYEEKEIELENQRKLTQMAIAEKAEIEKRYNKLKDKLSEPKLDFTKLAQEKRNLEELYNNSNAKTMADSIIQKAQQFYQTQIIRAENRAKTIIQDATSKSDVTIQNAVSKADDIVKDATNKADESIQNAVSKASDIVKDAERIDRVLTLRNQQRLHEAFPEMGQLKSGTNTVNQRYISGFSFLEGGRIRFFFSNYTSERPRPDFTLFMLTEYGTTAAYCRVSWFSDTIAPGTTNRIYDTQWTTLIPNRNMYYYWILF